MADSPEARKQAIAWALYDWGNSAFATTVMAGFFPVFFKKYWSAGADVAESTWNLGVANSIASLVVAILAPVLGAYADASHGKKRWLAMFAALGCLSTFALALVGMGQWPLASLCYVGATLGFAGSIVFYDALLVSVAKPEDSDRVSSLGYSLGYLGGGVLFAINIAMYTKPELFGLADGPSGVRASFAVVAVWWAVFTVPLMLRVHERGQAKVVVGSAWKRAVTDAARTFARARRMPQLMLFLGAYWLYIDGIDTIQRMAVDYGMSIGLDTATLMKALLLVNLIGFPATLGFARIAGRIGTKRAIMLGVGVFVVITVLGYSMQNARDFYVLALMVGLVQGGVQALSRSFFSRMVPPDDAGEFFGLYNMLGRFSAVIGPLLMGFVGLVTGSPRLSILSIALLLLGGATLLWFVREPEAGSAPAS